MYKLLTSFKPEPLMPIKVGSSQNIDGPGELKWDSGRCGTGITF